jgi:hypothetical protein
MKVKKLITVIITAMFWNPAQGQVLNKQDALLISYNIGFGGLAAGVGAIINKPKNVKWHKAFVRSLWQGAIGGSLNYAGKRMNNLIVRNQAAAFGWPAKIIHAAGSSIVYSAALNKEFLKYWSIDYGPARFDISLKDKPACRVRLMPGSIISFINVSYYGKLDIAMSLSCGNVAFRRKNYTTSGNYTIEGLAFNHAFMYVNSIDKYATVAHEINHLLQFREYLVGNTYFEPWAAKVKKSKIGSWTNRYIYIDMFYFNGMYMLEELRDNDEPKCYYSNFYEFEAERLANDKYVHRCR